MSITSHPFFNPHADRFEAERIVTQTGVPLLRHSSIEAHYAVTYYSRIRRRIVHTLLRHQADNSILDVSQDGIVWGHYATLNEFLDMLASGHSTLSMVAPALLPLLPAVVSRCEEDPIG
jgi:hypothetical protein